MEPHNGPGALITEKNTEPSLPCEDVARRWQSMKQEAGPPLDIKSVGILTLTGLNCEGCLFNHPV